MFVAARAYACSDKTKRGECKRGRDFSLPVDMATVEKTSSEGFSAQVDKLTPVSYTHLRAHET